MVILPLGCSSVEEEEPGNLPAPYISSILTLKYPFLGKYLQK